LNSLEGSLISVFQENCPELILYKSDIHPTMVSIFSPLLNPKLSEFFKTFWGGTWGG
jgi:hypothetical protein